MRTKKILVLVLVFLLGIFIGRFIFSDKHAMWEMQDEMELQTQTINDQRATIEQLSYDLEKFLK